MSAFIVGSGRDSGEEADLDLEEQNDVDAPFTID